MIKVFVTGASGNVGATIVRTIQRREGFALVGGWAKETGADIGTLAGLAPLGVKISDTLGGGLASSKPDVVIDFSATPILADNLKTYIEARVNAVIGTTGLTDEQLDPFKREVAASGLRWAVIPNYGLGVALVSDFIRSARKYYPYVTVTDQHTNEMANAPSGTAVALAQAACGETVGPVASRETVAGVMGANIGGVQVLSQRLPWPGPYSGHEITLARKDEVIRVAIQDYTSDIYMDGVFLTAEKISSFPAGAFVRSLGEVMSM
jgi:4-hydroxy-tetrahydrodipicolinate reductase